MGLGSYLAKLPTLARQIWFEACSDGIRTLFEAVIWPSDRLSGLHSGNQGRDTDDLHYAGHVVGEHVQRHFGGDVFQSPHLEVRRAHPGFDRAVWVLNRHAADGQLGGVVVQALLHSFQYVFMFPSADATVLAACAFVLDDTVSAVA